VLEAEAVVVWLDATYRPVRIPADVKQVFAELGGRQNAALNHKTL
jgi:acyl-CoA thioesterase FadM